MFKFDIIIKAVDKYKYGSYGIPNITVQLTFFAKLAHSISTRNIIDAVSILETFLSPVYSSLFVVGSATINSYLSIINALPSMSLKLSSINK